MYSMLSTTLRHGKSLKIANQKRRGKTCAAYCFFHSSRVAWQRWPRFLFVICTSNRLESSLFLILTLALCNVCYRLHRCIGVSYMRRIRTNKAQVAIVSHLKEVARLSSRLICRLYAALLPPIQVNYSFFGSSRLVRFRLELAVNHLWMMKCTA